MTVIHRDIPYFKASPSNHGKALFFKMDYPYIYAILKAINPRWIAYQWLFNAILT